VLGSKILQITHVLEHRSESNVADMLHVKQPMTRQMFYFPDLNIFPVTSLVAGRW